MKKIKITIDGQKLEVTEGVTLLEAAKSEGIEIPTLCYHEALGPYGACRVCMVEIIYSGKSKLTTACTYPVWDGLEVKTSSEKAMKARRFSVELLLARCPNVGTIQKLAKKMGVDVSRFKVAVNKNEQCILCGLCIRVCKDIIGKAAISFTNRGTERKVQTPFDTYSEDCIGCGACAFVCPTDAIKIEDINKMRKVHENTELELAKCKNCENFFATLKDLDYIKQKIDLSLDIFQLCPNCRKRKLKNQISG